MFHLFLSSSLNYRKRKNTLKYVTLLQSLAIVLLVFLLLVGHHTSAFASEKTGSGNWMNFTSYCGSGICVPFGTNHKAQATVNYYKGAGGLTIVYWQEFGGSLSPGSSPGACGSYQWLLLPSSYHTINGDFSIGGWASTGTICSPSSVCANYLSTRNYGLQCGSSNCTGKFVSASWFTNRCIPNSVSRTINLNF